MKFGVVNKSLILNRFVLHNLQRNITHLDVITRKTNIKLDILKGGGELEKSRLFKIEFEGGGDWKRAQEPPPQLDEWMFNGDIKMFIISQRYELYVWLFFLSPPPPYLT